MTVEELKKKKSEMEKAVADIVQGFMADTAVIVIGFEIKIAEISKAMPRAIIYRAPMSVQAKLEL